MLVRPRRNLRLNERDSSPLGRDSTVTHAGLLFTIRAVIDYPNERPSTSYWATFIRSLRDYLQQLGSRLNKRHCSAEITGFRFPISSLLVVSSFELLLPAKAPGLLLLAG
jgi:hypothetical protein